MDKALKVLRNLEELGKKEFIPSIGPVKGKVLSGVIKKYRPKTVLEIGTRFGYSAIVMARSLPAEGKIVTIELEEDAANMARRNIDDAGFYNQIDVMVGDALEIIPRLKEKFDMVFIDATKNEYFQYLKLAEKNLNKGSVIVADNVGVFEESLVDYLEYVRNSGKYKSRTVKVLLEFREHEEDAMEISVML